jgi:hypothetical protein
MGANIDESEPFSLAADTGAFRPSPTRDNRNEWTTTTRNVASGRAGERVRSARHRD